MGNLDSLFTLIAEDRKRLETENEEMRELLGYTLAYFSGEEGCKACPIRDCCESLPRCTFPEYFKGRAQEYV